MYGSALFLDNHVKIYYRLVAGVSVLPSIEQELGRSVNDGFSWLDEEMVTVITDRGVPEGNFFSCCKIT